MANDIHPLLAARILQMIGSYDDEALNIGEVTDKHRELVVRELSKSASRLSPSHSEVLNGEEFDG